MKMIKRTILLFSALLLLSSCNNKKAWCNDDLVKTTTKQLKFQTKLLGDSTLFPRSIKNGELRKVDLYDWTSGFFPGSLWYAYELTNDDFYKEQATKFTSYLENLKDYKDTHDLGFMVYCSYGNQFRLAKDITIVPVLVQTADNLISRFNEKTQTIRSWDFGKWQYPVIIDNMMNLELLFWASEYTKNNKYKDVAIRHANTTMKNHYRENTSSYHVLDYDTISGNVISKGTFQGQADESSWARGQAWGLYGFTMCYRFTKEKKHLDFAEKIANYIMNNVKTEDLIPYWDYKALDIPNAPRDASAAAITASALLELSQYVSKDKPYYAYAEKILNSLSSDKYKSKKGENFGFILKHSVGHHPANSEIDTPINYADYYYLEALKRYRDSKKH